MIDVPPRAATVLSTWTQAPIADGLIVIATFGYLVLAVRAGRIVEGGRWPWLRVAAWLAAMGVLVIALDSAVAVYGDVLFWVHMIQHLLLIMVVPVLVIWAQPIRLLRTVSGPRGQTRLERAVASRVVRVLTFPPITLAFYAAVVVLTHLTGFQQLAATDHTVRALETALYLLSGYLFFLPLVGSEAGPWSLPFLLRFVLLVAAMGVDTLAGVALMLTSTPLAPAYAAAHPGWGPGAVPDQGVAGAVMWFGGDGLMMLLMIAVGLQWGLADQDQQGLGSWLEGARRRALLGPGGADENAGDVDQDQRALDAYNAMLKSLHGRPAMPGQPSDRPDPHG
ncbi:cytochrome c oxidase assembly protein [Pseudonocardia acidicola]|uniref:Cytochrome c oxidase assembly protein n=1 Tax=Pseudonocardia acidicola TaxID=2724939 RepID=A0ABX1SKD3_9PSEU|nr:cytochrome c oxidase assembly protein [Pseudonocardia acidicola]NMI01997.1 cytochrome c oxidase assembly protein [Pseudonocardia acidicola]